MYTTQAGSDRALAHDKISQVLTAQNKSLEVVDILE